MKAWVYFFNLCNGSQYTAIVTSLEKAGVCCTKPDFADPKGYGLIFFCDLTCELLAQITKLKNYGRASLLAVAMNNAVFENGEVWRLLEAGAADVVPCLDPSEFVHTIVQRLERWQAIDALIEAPIVKDSLIGGNNIWLSVLRQIIEVARFTNAYLLILGESGTGKEMIARLVYQLDPKYSEGDFYVLDCGAIVPELSGSEFFGHERGAFTGAHATRDGAFALANGGCLFLDEVGELPLSLQSQLLRVIQEGTFKRVGGNNWFKTDFRLICATNRDLSKLVQEGRFRHDLYHRIANWIFTLPPLRERPDDILVLARHFMRQVPSQNGIPPMTPTVEEFLTQREYPGNIRELRQLVVRIMQRHVGPGAITPGDIPEIDRPREQRAGRDWRNGILSSAIQNALNQGAGLREIGRTAEELAVCLAVRKEEGSLKRAAERLGVTDRALQQRRAAARESFRSVSESLKGSDRKGPA